MEELMNRPGFARVVTFIALVAIAGCAPVAAACQPDQPGVGVPTAPQPRVVLVSRGDPASLATRPFATNAGSFQLVRVFNATLSYKDENQAPNPYLAQSVPQLDTDTWTVSQDGRMTTTWRLRPNLTW